MKTNTNNGLCPIQLAKEREQRKRNYWRAHDAIKAKAMTEMVKQGWRPK